MLIPSEFWFSDLRRKSRGARALSYENALILISTLLLCTAIASAQSSAIHTEIEQTYNFQPQALSSDEFTRISRILDQFWAKAKSQPGTYVPALREELANFSNPRFFLYDGSKLLLSLSDTPIDRKVALAAIAHSDLRDVQSEDYFFQVHRMATLNEDTTSAAFQILEEPNLTILIPEHALTLGQDYALVYMLLPTSQDYWLQPAIDRLQVEHDETAEKSLILLLWYAQTDSADKAIAAFASDASKPSGARDYANQIKRAKGKIGAKEKAQALASSEASLRQKRRERMQAVSDEALFDLNDYTIMLAAKRK